MKTFRLLALLLCGTAFADQTPPANPPTDPTLPPDTAYHITARDQNSRVWQRTHCRRPLHQFQLKELSFGVVSMFMAELKLV